MKHRYVLAALGALTVITGLTASHTGIWLSSADPGAVRLTVDGQPQAVQGAVNCTDTHTSATIIDVGSQISAQVFDNGNVPFVNINTGAVNLQYDKGGYGPGNASATVAGKSYTITGNMTGSDLNGVLKSFELDVTCP